MSSQHGFWLGRSRSLKKRPTPQDALILLSTVQLSEPVPEISPFFKLEPHRTVSIRLSGRSNFRPKRGRESRRWIRREISVEPLVTQVAVSKRPISLH
jgi:hypothetical protein